MNDTRDDFTIGIEEEYLLIDPESRDLVADPTEQVLKDCEAAIDPNIGGVSPEFLRAQVEVGTTVCRSISEARTHLRTLRKTVAGVAEEHGMKIIAASTHPFANWSRQRPRTRTDTTSSPRICRPSHTVC